MSKKSKKKSQPDIQITVEPEALNTITSTYDSIQKSAGGLMAALAVSLPTSEINESLQRSLGGMTAAIAATLSTNTYFSQIEETLSKQSKMWDSYLAEISEIGQVRTQLSSLVQIPTSTLLGLYTDIGNVERVTDVLVPQFIKELPPTTPPVEKEKIVDITEELKKENASLRAELEKLKQEKEQFTKSLTVKKVSKRGPQRYSDHGPGCMIIASGLVRAKRSLFRPNIAAYSPMLGNIVWR